MSVAAQTSDVGLRGTLANRLPLLPDADWHDLAALIDEICPIPENEEAESTTPDSTAAVVAKTNVVQASLRERDGLIQRALRWLGLVSVEDLPLAPLPVQQENVRNLQLDFVIYAQHRWESQVGDLGTLVYPAVGYRILAENNSRFDDVVAIIKATDMTHGDGGLGWATEPKRALDLLYDSARTTSPTGSDPKDASMADFWAGRVQFDMNDSAASSPLLSENPVADWHAIIRISAPARLAIDAWFAHRPARNYSDVNVNNPTVFDAVRALDQVEQLLLYQHDGGHPGPPTRRVWSDLRAKIRVSVILSAVCLVAISASGAATIAKWADWFGGGSLMQSISVAEASTSARHNLVRSDET